MKRGFARAHCAVGLCRAAFATGMLLVFRWELEDALLAGTYASVDAEGLGAAVDRIARAGGRPLDLWASSQAAHRFDIYYADAGGAARVMRADGAGWPLRDASDSGLIGNGAFWDTLTLVHTGLLGGETGRWVVAARGGVGPRAARADYSRRGGADPRMAPPARPVARGGVPAVRGDRRAALCRG